ncbi:Xaa-Pro dipeptidyl-peptidase [Halobacillus amylolyticus]|uniref:Xaa-Pro dipeptidyl-peptidase n=1 Tax=Halobacillus amylolyticus TaxID=2932259 RepID=A0ABY4H827_9BACI|nr:Xaa-Pro dipeptidyl-peptidase [Halobacillus amylolyticus]UOR11016.1 Xaa-Pro dipeptidyl-peptidase [Halobacillus amylolyticus]
MKKKVFLHTTFLLLILSTVLTVQPAGAEDGNSKPSDVQQIEVKDGKTQPVYSHEEAIRETVFIETSVDSDGDGELDRIHADIIRPKETEQGLKVPVIYEMSPYRAGLNPINFHDVDVPLNPVDHKKPAKKGKDEQGEVSLAQDQGATSTSAAAGPNEPSFPGYYDDYFVPRGYAVVLAESLGSGLSNGCATSGGENETLGTKAVIDWLNGKTKAYDSEGNLVEADWSTGSTGMMGISYNGTLPNAVSTTGVEGLETIVPIAAISSWYDYYRANGAVVAPGGYQGEDTDVLAHAVTTRANAGECDDVLQKLERLQDRETGDYNEYWDERNYVKDASKVEASVFAVHGLNDWNVKTKHLSQWWDALGENNVERKLWLHQSGHANPYYLRNEEWLDTLNKWFDYWLYDIDNNVMEEPMVDIQREDGNWKTYESWPAKDAKDISLNFQAEGASLDLKPMSGKNKTTATFVDNPAITAETLAENPDSDQENRLVYQTPKLESALRISGTPEVSIRASIDARAANLTALLVDYDPDEKSFEIVTRGWMDPQNRHSISKSHSLVPGKEYKFTWGMQPEDYIFEEGHQVGVVLLSSDHNYTIRPEAGTEITVDPKRSKVILPIVDGRKAITFSNE